MSYKIGEKLWHSGDEVTVTTEPYKMHGGMFQDATKEDGTIVCVVPPEQLDKELKEKQKQWKEQQDGFRRLRENG